jgi:PilZ domain
MRERRKNLRVEWNSQATICDRDGGFARLCIVSNFSNGGAKIVDPDPSALPDEFFLRLSPRSRARECHVAWRSKDGLGVIFIDEPKGLSEAAQERAGSLVGDQS